MAAFLVLTIGLSLTRSPWWDEGVFADLALNFRNFWPPREYRPCASWLPGLAGGPPIHVLAVPSIPDSA